MAKIGRGNVFSTNICPIKKWNWPSLRFLINITRLSWPKTFYRPLSVISPILRRLSQQIRVVLGFKSHFRWLLSRSNSFIAIGKMSVGKTSRRQEIGHFIKGFFSSKFFQPLLSQIVQDGSQANKRWKREGSSPRRNSSQSRWKRSLVEKTDKYFRKEFL